MYSTNNEEKRNTLQIPQYLQKKKKEKKQLVNRLMDS